MAPVLLLPSLVAGGSVVVAAGAVALVDVLDDLDDDVDEVVRVPSITDWGADNMVKTVRSL
jgi:hypothetical protein